MRIDIPLGVPFRFDDHKVVAVTAHSGECDGCFLRTRKDLSLSCSSIACTGEQRLDKTSIKFLEIKEEVEE